MGNDTAGNHQYERSAGQVKIVEIETDDTNDTAADDVPAPRGTGNRHFLAAWIVVSLMLGLGILWMLGASGPMVPAPYASYLSVDPATGAIQDLEYRPGITALRNFVEVGPGLLLIGISGTIGLLIAQGVSRRQS